MVTDIRYQEPHVVVELLTLSSQNLDAPLELLEREIRLRWTRRNRPLD